MLESITQNVDCILFNFFLSNRSEQFLGRTTLRGVQFDNITTNLKIHSWFLKTCTAFQYLYMICI